jgi:hypothetical protein
MVVQRWPIALPPQHHWPWSFCVIIPTMKCSTAVFCQLILHALLSFDRAFWVMASPDPSSHQNRQDGTCSGLTTWPPGLTDYTSANTDKNLRQWWKNHSSSGGRFDTQFGENWGSPFLCGAVSGGTCTPPGCDGESLQTTRNWTFSPLIW